MLDKRSKAEWVGDSLNVIFLGVLSLIMLYPMLYELFMSFSVASEVAKHRGILLWPLGFTLTPYRLVLAENSIITGYKNTLIVLSVGLVFNITFTSLGAYFLSRKNVLWFKPVMIMILITMYFSGGLVPTWLNIRNLGLYNKLWALIIPGAINTFNLILLRSYFTTIPDSLLESVFIDGGSHFTALFKVVIPVSLPAMMVMILYYGVGHWNSWFDALIYLRTRELWPLQMVLRDILIQGTDLDIRGEDLINYEQLQETTKAAIVIITTLPILMIYPFLQKYFVSGLMVGSLKG
jgi:putative aldouronate transport system permease protein